MKFSATALLLLSAASSIDAKDRTTGLEYDDQKDLVGRKLQGKKGDTNGGKKKDCTNGADTILACDSEISIAGRYVLDGNLKCGLNQNGITISEDNVHLDCQGYRIQGIGQNIGIRIDGAEHVTVSNCHVSNFFDGLKTFTTNGFWTDLVVRDSTFNNNESFGMTLDAGLADASTVNVVDSTFNGNGKGDPNASGGIVTISTVIGTIARSTLSNNVGPFAYGFVAQGNSEFTLIDVIANNNVDAGIEAAGLNTLVTVINSIACGNIGHDLSNVHIAQATTCDKSNPLTIDGRPVCQCPCKL
jgi:hypothetical protein